MACRQNKRNQPSWKGKSLMPARSPSSAIDRHTPTSARHHHAHHLPVKSGSNGFREAVATISHTWQPQEFANYDIQARFAVPMGGTL